MLSKNDVVTLQRHLSASFSVVILRRCYVTASFLCSICVVIQLVMLQRHLSVFFLCRYITSLLCYKVTCLCSFCAVIERRCYVTAACVCVLSVSSYNLLCYNVILWVLSVSL